MYVFDFIITILYFYVHKNQNKFVCLQDKLAWSKLRAVSVLEIDK